MYCIFILINDNVLCCIMIVISAQFNLHGCQACECE